MYLAYKEVQGYSNIQEVHLSQIPVSLEMSVKYVQNSHGISLCKKIQTTAALNSLFVCTFIYTLK